MSKILDTRTEVRIIDGKQREVVIQTLAPGNGGRSISKQYFGGRKGTKNKSRAGAMGLQDSTVERQVVR